MSEKWIGYGAAFLATTIFGLTFMFSKIALELVTPIHLVALRFLFSTCVLLLLAVFRVIPIHLKGKSWAPLVMISLFQPVAYFIFESYGLHFGTSAEGGLFLALIPVVTTLFAVVFLRENISVLQCLFLGCSVAGAIFIVLLDGFTMENGFLSKLFFLLAIISAAAFTVGSRNLSRCFSPWEITFVMSCTAAVIFNIWAGGQFLLAGNLWAYLAPLTNTQFFLSLLFLSIVASIFAFYCTNYALSRISASQYAVFNNYGTVVSMIAGAVFLQEEIVWYQWLGGFIIILGVWGTNYFQVDKNRLGQKK